MFTNLQSFKESLSNDKSNDAKLRMLIETAKEMMAAYNKAEEFENLKKEGNKEIEALLDAYNKTSIIANNTLIEVVKPYTSNRLNTKEYLSFVETSIDTIGADFKKVHDQVVILATKMSDGSEYIRANNNTKNLPTGTIIKNEGLSDIWNAIGNWFVMFKQRFFKLISNVQSELNNIKIHASTFLPDEIVTSEGKITENNDPSSDQVLALLEKAKKTLEHAKEQSYYEELGKMKENMVISLLKDFNAKGVVIDNKILALIKIQPKEKLELGLYADYITNAEKVNEGIAEMASNLMALHTSISEVSGSVRHYKDDSNSPEGTFDATFDYVNKKVIPPISDTTVKEGFGSIVKTIWNKIKLFFSNFKLASKKVDNALEALNF